jgi:hypothetical protein
MNTWLTINFECALPNGPEHIFPVVGRDNGNDLVWYLGGGGVDTGSNIGSFVAFLRFPKRMGEKHICLPITSDFLLPKTYLVAVHFKFFIS